MKINSGPGGYSNVVHMMDQMKLKKINQSIEIATEEQKIIAKRIKDNANMRSNSPGKGENLHKIRLTNNARTAIMVT